MKTTELVGKKFKVSKAIPLEVDFLAKRGLDIDIGFKGDVVETPKGVTIKNSNSGRVFFNVHPKAFKQVKSEGGRNFIPPGKVIEVKSAPNDSSVSIFLWRAGSPRAN